MVFFRDSDYSYVNSLLCLSSTVIFFSNPLKLLFPFHFPCCFHLYPLLCFQQCLCHLMLFLVLPSFLFCVFVFFHFFPELCQSLPIVLPPHARVFASVSCVFFMAEIAVHDFPFSSLPPSLLSLPSYICVEFAALTFLWLLIFWSRVTLLGPVNFRVCRLEGQHTVET